MQQNRKEIHMLPEKENEVFATLGGEPLYIIPCLLYSYGGHHVFPYRIKFLLPQFCSYADTQQSTICIAYLSGAYLHPLQFRAETVPAKQSFLKLLEGKGFKPVTQLLTPVESELMPLADKVICPIQTNEKFINRYQDIKSDFVIQRYACYYRLLYETYKPAIEKLFGTPAHYLSFQELDIRAAAELYKQCNAPCVREEIIKRRKMLAKLTGGYISIDDLYKDKQIQHETAHEEFEITTEEYYEKTWSELDQYEAAMERDLLSAAKTAVTIPPITERLTSFLTLGLVTPEGSSFKLSVRLSCNQCYNIRAIDDF
jgi:hypothetical protein